MQYETQAANESTGQHRTQSLLQYDGYWRAYTTNTHPDNCAHAKDARVLYGKTDLVGNPILQELCTDCGLKTDKTLDGVSREAPQL